MSMVKPLYDAVYAHPLPVSRNEELDLHLQDAKVNIIQCQSTVPLRDDGSQGDGNGEPAFKETDILESNKGHKEFQETSARKNLESTIEDSSTLNGKSSSTYLETPFSVKLLKHDKILHLLLVNLFKRKSGYVNSSKSLHDAVNSSPPSLSSINEVNKEKKNSSSDNEFSALVAYGTEENTKWKDHVVSSPGVVLELGVIGVREARTLDLRITQQSYETYALANCATTPRCYKGVTYL
ncbi:hypothetical protein VNO78_25005 [Psophocarpus tetragonolobus]|uniref:Uncharacterized protein n=1 Tax=Psophocarpus tetragonolobus TaxID=3891 RepID=A0AAN9S565_PSOTE